MINKKLEEAINKQINEEFYSAYLYLSMASYFENINLAGFSNWMKVQYQEEISHVMKFFNYLNERGGRVILQTVETPKHEWESPLHAFQDTLAHEQLITGLINGLLDLATAEKDHATCNFLQWYVQEQVEEEATASEYVSKIEMVKNAPEALFFLDKELAARVFVDATQK